MSASQRIHKAAEYLFLADPLLFNVFCTHTLKVNNTLANPMRTGNMVIEYNPGIIDGLSEASLNDYLRVELIRIVLKHPYQRVPEYPDNVALSMASDITVNDVTGIATGLSKSSDWGLERNLSYESYYAGLKGMFEDKNSSNEMQSLENNIKLKIFTDNNKEKSLLWNNNDESIEQINKEIEKAIEGDLWGTLPKNLIALITSGLKVALDYRKVLTMFRSSILSSSRRLTRTKPNRRYGFAYMGSRYDFTTSLCVAVDVSGSISKHTLSAFFSVINTFFKYGIKTVDVIEFDTEVKDIVYTLKKARKQIEVYGFGGTDLQAPINWFKNKSQYDGMIIFTDGYADVPVVNDKRHILWIFSSEEAFNKAQWVKNIKNSRATFMPLPK